MDDLTPGQEEAVAATVGAIQRIAMAVVELPTEGRAAHYAMVRRNFQAALMEVGIEGATERPWCLPPPDLSHGRRPAGVVFPRRRLACFFPLFRPGALPIELARGGFPDCLCWPAPSARPLQRTVDQHRQQKHRTDDLHDRKHRHRLDGLEHGFSPWLMRPPAAGDTEPPGSWSPTPRAAQ